MIICAQWILKMDIYYQENLGVHYLSQHLVSQWVTPPTAEILCVKNMRAFVVCVFQTAPMIFFHIFSIYFFNYSIKNPQTTNAPTFLTHNISAVGGVVRLERASRECFLLLCRGCLAEAARLWGCKAWRLQLFAWHLCLEGSFISKLALAI